MNATLGLFGAWMLIGLFSKGWERHAATLLLVATPFYTFNAYKYNANTIFISLWPWTLYFFIRSADLMSRRDALIFGVFAAACILSKYYAVLLLATCGLSLVVHPNGRRYLFSPLPWIAGAVFSVLVLPHVLWALTSKAPPVAYAMGLTGKGWLFTGQHIGRFVSDLLLFQAAMAALRSSCVCRNSANFGSSSQPSGAQPVPIPDEASPFQGGGDPFARRGRAGRAPSAIASQISRRTGFGPSPFDHHGGPDFPVKIEAVVAISVFPLMPFFVLRLVLASG